MSKVYLNIHVFCFYCQFIVHYINVDISYPLYLSKWFNSNVKTAVQSILWSFYYFFFFFTLFNSQMIGTAISCFEK